MSEEGEEIADFSSDQLVPGSTYLGSGVASRGKLFQQGKRQTRGMMREGGFAYDGIRWAVV